jgi:hypothetical protein
LLTKAEAEVFELLLTIDKKNPVLAEFKRPKNRHRCAWQLGMAHGAEAS